MEMREEEFELFETYVQAREDFLMARIKCETSPLAYTEEELQLLKHEVDRTRQQFIDVAIFGD